MTVEKIKEFKPKNLDVIRVKINEALASLKSRKYKIKVINVKDKKEYRFTHQDVSMFLKNRRSRKLLK